MKMYNPHTPNIDSIVWDGNPKPKHNTEWEYEVDMKWRYDDTKWIEEEINKWDKYSVYDNVSTTESLSIGEEMKPTKQPSYGVYGYKTFNNGYRVW